MKWYGGIEKMYKNWMEYKCLMGSIIGRRSWKNDGKEDGVNKGKVMKMHGVSVKEWWDELKDGRMFGMENWVWRMVKIKRKYGEFELNRGDKKVWRVRGYSGMKKEKRGVQCTIQEG